MMQTISYRDSWRTIMFLFIALNLLISCVQRPFVPVNTGREYGNPKTPFLVSHVPEKNQWTLNRVGHHNIFKRVICFDYTCRKMIGRSKTLLIISKKEYIKVIKKNAERGFFNTAPPKQAPPSAKPDSLAIPVDTVFMTVVNEPPTPVASGLRADSLITFNEFLFETNSYKLRAEHFEELDLLGKFLQAHPLLEVNVSGHTDNVGDEQYNVTLSTRRAEVVAEYLVGKGVDYDHVVFQGFGSAVPIASNNTEAGRSKNRRVEILIRNPKK